MQYKTMTLELILEEPELYEQLRSSKRLLPAMDAYAIELRDAHMMWKETLSRTRPGTDPRPIAAEALEMAIQELRERLHCASPMAEPLSLDAAMSHIRRHTPHA